MKLTQSDGIILGCGRLPLSCPHARASKVPIVGDGEPGSVYMCCEPGD